MSLLEQIEQVQQAGPLGIKLKNYRNRMERRRDERDFRENLVQLAEWLEEYEQSLIISHFMHSVPVKSIARLRGIPERRMYRELQLLRQRVSDPMFHLVVRFSGSLPHDVATVARQKWIKGMSLREMVTEHNSLHYVRLKLLEAKHLLAVASYAGRLGHN